jgi:hypothetical protein
MISTVTLPSSGVCGGLLLLLLPGAAALAAGARCDMAAWEGAQHAQHARHCL